jgi:cytochrome P450
MYKHGGGPQQDAAFAEAFAIAQNDVVVRDRLGKLSMLMRDKKAQQAIKVCHEYVDQFVDDAVQYNEMTDIEKKAAGGGEKYIFLHELAKSMKDKKRLRCEALNVLLAGRDTTASLLGNMFFELAKQPGIWAKLREEVAQFEGRPPTYEQLKRLKYLRWCMNECQYLHSSFSSRLQASHSISNCFHFLPHFLSHHFNHDPNLHQPSASTPSSPVIPASPNATPSYPLAAAPPAHPPSSSPEGPS